MAKHLANPLEIRFSAALPFRLEVQETQDGARVEQEIEQRKREMEAAKKLQQPLFAE